MPSPPGRTFYSLSSRLSFSSQAARCSVRESHSSPRIPFLLGTLLFLLSVLALLWCFLYLRYLRFYPCTGKYLFGLQILLVLFSVLWLPLLLGVIICFRYVFPGCFMPNFHSILSALVKPNSIEQLIWTHAPCWQPGPKEKRELKAHNLHWKFSD